MGGRRTQEDAAQAIVLMNGAFLGQNRLRCSWATQKQVPLASAYHLF